jgi:O-antigen/teichoic acid export membrane protein
LLLTQVDKVLLSRLLTLADYGRYTLAATVAGALYMLITPIATAWSPKLCELYAKGDQAGLARTFHQGAQLVTALAGSAAIVVMLFAETLLQLWTRDAALAASAAPLVSVLMLGNLLNGLMWIPYQTQLAHGWTSLTVRVNCVAVALIVPAILWAVPRWGAVGAAWVWVSLNAAYVLIAIHFMYRKILTQEKWRWYRQDLLQPLLAAALVASASAWAMPATLTSLWQLLWLLLACALTLLASALAAPAVRAAFLVQVRLRFKPLRISTTL